VGVVVAVGVGVLVGVGEVPVVALTSSQGKQILKRLKSLAQKHTRQHNRGTRTKVRGK